MKLNPSYMRSISFCPMIVMFFVMILSFSLLNAVSFILWVVVFYIWNGIYLKEKNNGKDD